MNWLDFVIIGIVVAGLLCGLKTGLGGAIINAVVVLIGWLVAGQFADDIGGVFGDSATVDTYATVIFYGIIVIVSIIVSWFVSKIRFIISIVQFVLNIVTLGTTGMVNTLGGLALGLIVGLVLAGAFIVVLARVTYDFDIPDISDLPVGGDRVAQALQAAQTVEELASALEAVGGDQAAEALQAAQAARQLVSTLESVGGDQLAQAAQAAEAVEELASLLELVEGDQAAQALQAAKQVTSALGSVKGAVANIEETRESLEGALLDSALTGVFVTIVGAIPGNTFGFLPSDFATAIDILDENIENKN